MPMLRVHNFTISLDGFAAGPNQRAEAPFGDGGADQMHEWMFATKSLQQAMGQDGGVEGVDDAFVVESQQNIGATIMGRNMFGPVRGPWADESWTGWWGEDPPFHHDVFVLTHHPRQDLPMAGGTTFHFTDDAPETVLQKAFDAAGGKDVSLGGGAATIRQFLAAGLVDQLHVVIVPVLLGSGARLFENLAELGKQYACTELVGTDAATHARIVRRNA